MVIKTQLTSPVADKAQQGMMELLLINHPLDCPICDKGGECPLQNQAMSNGRAESRFVDVSGPTPSRSRSRSQVLLDRERCVLCQRCTRFSEQIAGDPFIELLERGAAAAGRHVQRQPVPVLLLRQHRADLPGRRADRRRPTGSGPGPFDLMSTPSVCEHCSSGCAQRTDWRRGKVTRRLAGEDPAVNEEWNCDKGRWAFQYADQPDRLLTPLVRDARPASWSRRPGREALERGGRGAGARPATTAGSACCPAAG